MYNPGSNTMRDRNYEALVRDGITAAKNGNRRLAFSLVLTQPGDTDELARCPPLVMAHRNHR